MRISKSNFNGEFDACANEEESKHEIIESAQEEAPVRGHFVGWLSISAKLSGSLIEISRVQTVINVGSELFTEAGD